MGSAERVWERRYGGYGVWVGRRTKAAPRTVPKTTAARNTGPRITASGNGTGGTGEGGSEGSSEGRTAKRSGDMVGNAGIGEAVWGGEAFAGHWEGAGD